MTARIDSTILHEIARVIGARAKVPERVRIQGKPYQITYLEDHKQRLEEAIRRHDNDRLGMLLAGGVAFWIGIEALINMSVLLGLLPFAGNALPFFSFGGSNLVTTLAGVGLLLNISRRQPSSTASEGYVSTIGIGWRHRRRRVSRLGHHRRARLEG